MSQITESCTSVTVIEPEIVQEPKNPVPKGFVPWKPGQSGNPAGKPKTKAIRELIIKHLRETVKDGRFKGQKRAVEAVNRLYREDLRTYFAYAFGKPVETHLLATMDGNQDAVNPLALSIARELAKEKLE